MNNSHTCTIGYNFLFFVIQGRSNAWSSTRGNKRKQNRQKQNKNYRPQEGRKGIIYITKLYTNLQEKISMLSFSWSQLVFIWFSLALSVRCMESRQQLKSFAVYRLFSQSTSALLDTCPSEYNNPKGWTLQFSGPCFI